MGSTRTHGTLRTSGFGCGPREEGERLGPDGGEQAEAVEGEPLDKRNRIEGTHATVRESNNHEPQAGAIATCYLVQQPTRVNRYEPLLYTISGWDYADAT